MKSNRVFLLILTLTVLATGGIHAQGKAEKSFESLKMLEGEWVGTNPADNPVVVKYEVYSGGSAVMEKLQPQGEPSMITVYHMDDGKLMMTHYCSAGNQPRMKGKVTGPEDDQIDFVFVDGTNLKTHTNGHMQSLSIVFKDKNHIEQVWTFRQGGEDKPGRFKLVRKI